jgi:hypothetical protein
MRTETLELNEELAALLRQMNQSVQPSATELMVMELYRRGAISGDPAFGVVKGFVANFALLEPRSKCDCPVPVAVSACHGISVPA